MKTYSFSMSVLYQTIRIVLMNCSNNLAAFTSFKTKYSADFIAGLQTELQNAEIMKGDKARSAEHESLRIEMLPMAETCREKWQWLKRYIADAFGPDLEETNWFAAGWQYYAESVSSWDKLRDMCNMANVYMAENEDKLKGDGYMPDDFRDAFAELCAVFNSKYDAFLIAQETARQGTADKIEANNTIYMKVQALCQDGQTIFMKDEVKKKLFSMEAVSELVQPTGPAGLNGVVTKDGQPQAGLIVELENGNKSVITDAEGMFDFGNNLASGTDTIVVKQGDEILMEEEVVIPAGVTKHEEVEIPVT